MRTQQGIPNLAGRWINPDGTPTQPFIQLVLTLWSRTGGSQGVSSDDLALVEALLSAKPVPPADLLPINFVLSAPASDPVVEFPLPLQPPPPDFADALLIALTLLRPITTTDSLGLGTAAAANTGTSGHTLPFLDGTNTFSGVETFSKPINLTPVTLASLASGLGARATITDSTVVAAGNFGAAAIGGGANHVPVYWDDGTSAWRIG